MDLWVFLIAMTGIVGVFGFLITCALIVYRLVARRQGSRALSEEEGRMLQELWDGLLKMEERIANLEAILIQRERP